MEGVRANLNHALDLKLKSDPIRRARSADEVPLSTALALKVRERLTGQAAPKDVRAGLAMVDQWIEDKAGADLDALAMAIDDQRAFQKLTSAMLEHLQLIDADVPPETDDSEPQEEGAEEEQSQEDRPEERRVGKECDSTCRFRVARYH